MAWDNGLGGDVTGVGWGDKYQFKTTDAGPVRPGSPWDYTQANVVPYDLEWSAAADAEMGLVATQSWQTRISGGDYGGGLLMQKWGKSGTNLLTDMPDWLWPFQLDQYELPYGTTSHRVAWGTAYGAVGQTKYPAFGQTFSGYPLQSYSVFVVLGAHSASAVTAQVHEIEVVQGATLTATRGSVSAQGPAGVARSDTAAYSPSGFDPVYAAWDAHAAGNAATLVFNVPGGSLTNPVIHLHDYTAATVPHVALSGSPLTPDTDYFATIDAASKSAWITLNFAVTGNRTLAIDP
jgi:hypothetical protein